MKTLLERIKDKSGSTLIIVIVAVSFVGILGTLILALTTMNLQMKTSDKLTRANFYSAEIAMDEIRAGLEEQAAIALKSSYEKMLAHFVEKDSKEDRDNYMAVEFKNDLLKGLGLGGSTTNYDPAILKKYISHSGVDLITSTEMDSSRPNCVVLKGIEVAYEDSAGYSTKIRSDIKISAPNDLNTVISGAVMPFGNYALIADKTISTNSSTNIAVDGSMYAGGEQADVLNKDKGGIFVKAGHLSVSGDNKIVTRSDIVVENNSSITMGEEAKAKQVDVYANNIRTFDNGSEYTADLNILGNIYVKDDLILDAEKSNVKLAGKYHGFNFTATSQTPIATVAPSATPSSTLTPPSDYDSEESSAIMINNQNSKLDMTGITDLIIAGSSFVSAKQVMKTTSKNDILMGESLTVKHNQLAYLVPNEFMVCGHNPLTEDDLKSAVVQVDFGSNKIVEQYLKSSAPYKTISYNSGVADGLSLTYYYLNFKNQDAASKYFQSYYNVNKAKIDSYMKLYADAYGQGVLLPTTFNRFVAAGNVLSYKNSSTLTEANVDNPDVLDPVYAKEEASVSQKYTGITETLSEPASFIPKDRSSMFRTILATESANPILTLIEKNIAANNNEHYTIPDGKEKYDVIFATGNYNVPKDMKGLIVATGNVTLNYDFTGTIIAGGNIEFSILPVTITASNDIISKIFEAGNPEINKYFKTYPVADASSEELTKINISNLTAYENWSKNEP